LKDILWNQNFSMGSPIIDAHHQKLIGYINDLDHAIEGRKASAQYLLELAQKLHDYTQYHFKVEEEYMQRFGYPEFEAHRDEHEAFIAEVVRLKQSLATDARGAGVRLTSYLKSWLIQHILVIDKEYAIYYEQKGLHVD